jgi:DNA-directed RNA polymerase specialized sigma24 family protein
MGHPQVLDDVLPKLCDQLRLELRRILAAFQIPPQDAEDLLQTMLLHAVMKWPEIRNPTAWLLGTLQKCCALYWREHRLRSARFVAIEPDKHDVGVVPPQQRRVVLADLETLCRRLPRRQRAVVALYCHQGLPAQAVARATGLRLSSVRKTARRAVDRLREVIGDPTPRRPPCPHIAAGSPWSAPVDGYLASGAYVDSTRPIIARQLARAAAALGACPLAQLTGDALARYRVTVIAGDRAPRARAETLARLRSFFLWTGEHGWHALQPVVIREALRSPGRLLPVPVPPIAVGSPWSAPVDAFLSGHAGTTRLTYASRLAEAAAMLGGGPLAELTAEALVGYRAVVMADGRAPVTQAKRLATLRSFLLWTGKRGWHALQPPVVHEVLRLPRGYERPFATLADRFHARALAAAQSKAAESTEIAAKGRLAVPDEAPLGSGTAFAGRPA